MPAKGFAKPSQKCIEALEKNGCSAQSWKDVLFAKQPDVCFIRNVRFTGKVKIGSFSSSANADCPPQGLYNTHIHNSTVADNVTIENVGLISNCDIGPDVLITNCKSIKTVGRSAFGVGVEAQVINEAGGREVPIFPNLSPQTAYLFAICRNRPVLIEKLTDMAKKLTEKSQSDRCLIQQNASVTNAGSITNVNIGPYAVIDGPSALENGSVVSSKKSPALVGTAVIARDFIIAQGAEVFDNAHIKKCFIGQHSQVGYGFNAENCLFFLGSQMLCGEACSVFAGPFSVSHHKSSLLIACMLSFFNAGSATNQSNHMYKLGPVHQAVLERGCKSASGSHLVWPARIAPFNTILGKHNAKIDTSIFPFSYLIEQNSRSILIPAAALKSIGTFRDVNKWQNRLTKKNSRITQGLFNPYLAQNIPDALSILTGLKNRPGTLSSHNNVMIPHSVIPTAIKRYQSYLDCCICQPLIELLKNESAEKAFKKIADTNDDQTDLQKWIDIAGLIAPASSVNQLIDKIESQKLKSIQDIEEQFDNIHRICADYQLTWSCRMLQEKFNKSVVNFDINELKTTVNHWIAAKEKIYQLNMQDCKKEFAKEVKISFGIGADIEQIDEDFRAVRGTPEKSDVFRLLNDQFRSDKKTAEQIIAQLK